jgi:hypothetical protein
LKELYNCGVNLLPCVEDAETAHICRKLIETEENAIYDLAMGIKAFSVKSIRWSTTLPKD